MESDSEKMLFFINAQAQALAYSTTKRCEFDFHNDAILKHF